MGQDDAVTHLTITQGVIQTEEVHCDHLELLQEGHHVQQHQDEVHQGQLHLDQELQHQGLQHRVVHQDQGHQLQDL